MKYGKSASDYFKENETAAQIYHRAMQENSELSGKLIVETYDFSPFKTIVDVGGGIGSLLVNILLKYSTAFGINFDLPELQNAAETYFKEKGVASRCQYIGGDFFKSIPSGGDLYIMKAILHGKSDEASSMLLNLCKAVLPLHGKVLLIERVIVKTEKNYLDVCINDMNMLNVTRGHIRTITEYEALFKNSGYILSKIYTLPDDISILEIQVEAVF